MGFFHRDVQEIVAADSDPEKTQLMIEPVSICEDSVIVSLGICNLNCRAEGAHIGECIQVTQTEAERLCGRVAVIKAVIPGSRVQRTSRKPVSASQLAYSGSL